jgi:poly(A) polymerase Pap1
MVASERLRTLIHRLLPRTDERGELLRCVKAWACLGVLYGIGGVAYMLMTIRLLPEAAIGLAFIIVVYAAAKGLSSVAWCGSLPQPIGQSGRDWGERTSLTSAMVARFSKH